MWLRALGCSPGQRACPLTFKSPDFKSRAGRPHLQGGWWVGGGLLVSSSPASLPQRPVLLPAVVSWRAGHVLQLPRGPDITWCPQQRRRCFLMRSSALWLLGAADRCRDLSKMLCNVEQFCVLNEAYGERLLQGPGEDQDHRQHLHGRGGAGAHGRDHGECRRGALRGRGPNAAPTALGPWTGSAQGLALHSALGQGRGLWAVLSVTSSFQTPGPTERQH